MLYMHACVTNGGSALPMQPAHGAIFIINSIMQILLAICQVYK